MTPLARLMGRLVYTADGCLEFSGHLRAGYGRVKFDGAVRQAHRVVYELTIGPVPDGLDLDHLCRNRACCNPHHLEPVTRMENSLRGVNPRYVAFRNGTCTRGLHDITAQALRPSGGPRFCRECANAKKRGALSC